MAKPVKHYGKWRIRWLDDRGERRSSVYDSYQEADYQLRKFQVSAEEVRRGFQTATIGKKIFSELCDYWLQNRAKDKRSQKDDISIIRRHLRPAFGDLALTHLTVERVDQFKATLGHLHDKTKNNILTLLISLLNQAKRLRWLVEVPSIQKPRLRLFDKDFRFLKSVDEITRFLDAARIEGDLVFSLYATATYTGMRQGELAGLRWTDIDFDRKLITVQRSFDGPTKSGSPRYVPLLDALAPILKAWRLKSSGVIVFPNGVGKMLHSSCNLFRTTFHRTLDHAGFPKRMDGGKVRSYIVFHDLRHTFASHWVMNGGDLFKLQKILGHESIAMTLRYAHLAPDAYAADYDRFNKIAVSTQLASIHQIKEKTLC